MKWFAYILQSSSSGRYYYGSTNDLERRLWQHNSSHTPSTRNKGQWKLIYSEEFETEIEARKRERKIKTYKAGNALKKLLAKQSNLF